MSESRCSLRLLLSRLACPSGLVRERAASGLARLLAIPAHGAEVCDSLLEWIGSQKLESLAGMGLLPFVKAQLDAPASYIAPELNTLISACNRPSPLYRALLAEIHPDVPSFNMRYEHSGDLSEDFRPSPFFQKYNAGIYGEHSSSIERRKGIPFINHWAYEWEYLLSTIGIQESDTAASFRGMDDREHFSVDFSPLMIEVLISAFLRSLAWAESLDAIDPNLSFLYALTACPIDTGLWQTKPHRVPEWWPTVAAVNEEIDTPPTRLWQRVNELWQKGIGDDSMVIAQTRGLVQCGKLYYNLHIRGAYQRCNGPMAPDADALAVMLDRLPLARCAKPGLATQGYLMAPDSDAYQCSLDNWDVQPAYHRLRPWVSPRWQYWRLHRDICTSVRSSSPAPFRLECNEQSLTTWSGDNIVGIWEDWTHGISDTVYANLPPNSGEYLLVPRSVIDAYCYETEATFCWVCTLTRYEQKYSFGNFDTFDDHAIIGGSRIIRRM